MQGGPGLRPGVGLLESQVSPVQHFGWMDGQTDGRPLSSLPSRVGSPKSRMFGEFASPEPPNFLLCLPLSLTLGKQQGPGPEMNGRAALCAADSGSC